MIRGFAHDGLIVSVDAPEEDMIWLEGFLDPAFDVVAAPVDAVHVVYQPGFCPPIASDSTVARVAFAFDADPVRLPESPLPDGALVHDAKAHLTFEVTRLGRRVRLVYEGDRLDARFRLMRVVREFAHNHAVGTGGLMLHAAAVTIGGAAIAIAGSKGAGKTTLALQLLAVPGVGYLSNDRLLVRTPGAPLGFAVPTVVALRAGTRELLPELADRLRTREDFRQIPGQLGSPPVAAAAGTDTWYISPHQLCRAVDRPLHKSAPLSAIVFPASDRASGRTVRRLSQPEASARLHDSLLGSRTRTYASEVFVASNRAGVDEAHLFSACDGLASRVGCFECAVPNGLSIEHRGALLSQILE